jgi:hypothetical protein
MNYKGLLISIATATLGFIGGMYILDKAVKK